MRLCDETITLISSKVDADTGYDVYNATIIRGASWHCEIASTVDSSGLKAADKFNVRIPTDADFGGKTYIPPNEYVNADPDRYFTLRNGDTIIRGAVTGSDLSPAALRKAYAEVAVILGVTDNRMSRRSPHWKVVGR